MRRRPCEAIKLPNDNRVELLALRISHQPVKLRTVHLGASNPFIHIDFREFPTLPIAELAYISQLDLRVLMMVAGANPCVCNDFNGVLPLTRSIHHSNELSTIKLSTTCEMNCKHRGSRLGPKLPVENASVMVNPAHYTVAG